ncbi:MAG: outer membrane homotrimeric porin [Desulfovibrionaceae bacterium]|nr:outer membrane homotrimeric porin [Desulfovibrionaceae bacterium]
MKKLATLLIAAGLVFSMAPSANAVDFKAKGNWMMDFEVGNNGGFTNNTGYSGDDNFEAKQRVRLWVDAVASENLSGQVFFEIGTTTWGKAEHSGALGADDTCIKVRRAFIDWMIPETDIKVRMGIQGFGLPSFTMGKSQIFEDDVAGVTVSTKFTDNVGLSVFWLRPYNDNYASGDSGKGQDKSNFMDNVDVFGLTVPLSFDGVKVTPYGLIAAIGPNALSADKAYGTLMNSSGDFSKSNLGTSWAQMRNGLLPAWGYISNSGRTLEGVVQDEYATAWFAGVTADITVADPFRVAIDVMGGGTNWSESRMNRAGWMAAALVEYKMDFGIPGIIGWYSSGDDDDLGNGSERMPYLTVGNGDNSFSNYAFDGGKYLAREATIANTMAGTWGVGLRVKDMSFLENLKHTFRLNLIGGTNDSGVLKKIYRQQALATNPSFSSVNSASYGVGGLYMTEEDYALEIGLENTYKMYENFKICLDANYIAMWMSDSKYGGVKKQLSGKNGNSSDVRDAWNISVNFAYEF